MRAEVAISTVKTPHTGRFVSARKVTSTLWKSALTNGGEPTVHLEIQRNGGPYVVLRMDFEAAYEIARQMLDVIKNSKEAA